MEQKNDCVGRRDQEAAQQACILREAFAQGKTCIKTFRCSNALRWRRPNENEVIALMEATHGKHAPVLQQAWECLEPGEVDWRDVPMEAPNIQGDRRHAATDIQEGGKE